MPPTCGTGPPRCGRPLLAAGSSGFETAGGHYRIEVPGRSLLRLLPPDPQISGGAVAAGPTVRRAGPDDAEQVIAVLGRVAAAARECGPSTYDVPSSRYWLADSDL